MQWNKFVFSGKPAHRLLCHLVFWVVWWLYFSVCYYLYELSSAGTGKSFQITLGSHLLLKTLLLLAVDAIACYTFIFLILPGLIQGKWFKTFGYVLFLSGLLFAAGYYLYWNVFPFVDALFGSFTPNTYPTRFWPAVSIGLIDPLKVVAAAAIIRYVKCWWVKQKESEKLEREKVTAELQLLKAQIHPNFLFTALNNIYDYSLAASPRAPEMLLKLSDLLSYMLYECDQPLVPIEKEIEMMKDYMAIEKIRMGDSIDMELSIREDMTGKMIAPFLLLPFIENSFTQSSRHLTEQAWINMDISIEGETFSMKLANGIIPDNSSQQPLSQNCLANVKKRLSLMYPEMHELKITVEAEMLMVLLKIQLGKTGIIQRLESEEAFNIKQAHPVTKLYASQS